jgi:hypothetical protein
MAIRTLLAIAAHEDLEIDQMDAVTAFLQPHMEDNAVVWVEMPTGFKKGLLACLIRKGMYGLKQSARLWAKDVRAELTKLGYQPLHSDECIYYNKALRIFVATHVDDFLLIGPSSSELAILKAQLSQQFKMKDLGPCKFFLGVHITRDRKNREIHLNQAAYIDKIIKTFGMMDAVTKSTLMESNALQILAKNTGIATTDDVHLYQSIIGSLMYLMIQTRPDLAFPVSLLSRFATNPSLAHIGAAKRVIRYLKHTPHLGAAY